MRIRLEYFDQNEILAPLLPRTGTVVRELTIDGLGGTWHAIALDEPLEYNGRGYAHVVIRSRWEGQQVGESKPTSVFVLLPRDPGFLNDARSYKDAFDHVAWGMSHTV